MKNVYAIKRQFDWAVVEADSFAEAAKLSDEDNKIFGAEQIRLLIEDGKINHAAINEIARVEALRNRPIPYRSNLKRARRNLRFSGSRHRRR